MPDRKNIVFDIQKFSVHDGPGVRSTVFLKGCPLRCVWCHNPESWNPRPELFYDPAKCVQCGRCADVCPTHAHRLTDGHRFERGKCIACGACVGSCPAQALELCGTERGVAEIMAEVLKDLPFYRNSGGGVTFSGGEPMTQFPLLLELLTAAKREKLHVVLESCGFAPRANYAEVLPLVDLFFFDVKTVDPEKHRVLTGKSNRLILENLRLLDRAGAELHLRCPLVPGVNDSDAELCGIAALANRLTHVRRIDVEPYHPLGVDKARRLGMVGGFATAFPPEETVKRWIDRISGCTAVPVVRQ